MALDSSQPGNKTFLQRGAAKRLWLERLPGYAPDLNPAEGVWHLLKGVELRNICCRDLAHLKTELIHARERLRHRLSLLLSCVHRFGYSV